MEKLNYTMQNVIELAQLEKVCFGKDAWSITNLRGEFSNEFSHFFAEKRDGRIVGYVCVRTMYEEAQICNIAVIPQFRRQGVASELLKTMVNFAASQNCTRCELEVNAENTAAVELYKKCGFEIAGLRKNFYRRTRYNSRDAYTMVLQLTKSDNL